ncbi:MAG: DUF4270 domain-containing protein [Haliscomenobacter sp.]|nr:DUF4270 domain-containing protein [Haliscomenobacter sp.]MBK8654436.1 DUF4270 domain-containing protein [Haliscomenobacter sp.]MBP9075624.1 DUF4270 domain-containing protein [Haliscomenobacter sp.]
MNCKRILRWAFIWALGAGALSCTNPISAGLDLLDEDLLNLVYIDTFTVETGTEQSDSVRTHNPLSLLNAYIVGKMNDPLLGNSEASLVAQLIPEVLQPSFTNALVDSVVLVLPYDTSKFYGEADVPLSLDVFRLTETISAAEAHFSNDQFETNPVPLGRGSVFPSRDSLFVFDYSQGIRDTIGFPHMRIPLNNSLGQELLNLDTLYYTTDSLFQSYFKGICVKPASGGSIVGVNLNSNRAGLVVYYRVDTLQRQFRFQFSPFVANISLFKHEIAGKEVEKYLAPPSGDNPYFFVQGMAGVNGTVRFPHITSLKNVIINKAELELHTASLPSDDAAAFFPAPSLVLYYRDSDGAIQVINDVLYSTDDLSAQFGGTYRPGTDTTPGYYRMNLSAHIQDMVEGKISNELIVSLLPKTENGSRTVLYGASHPAYKAKLKIAYTQLK